MKKIILFIFLLFSLSRITNGFAQSLVINEVNLNPCCGTNAQSNFEWIEIYNQSNTDTIDIAGWYLRTDVSNTISSPVFGDDELVAWSTRNPGIMPYDLIPNQKPYIINSTKIPPGKIALLLDPTYNSPGYANIDIPDSTIVLTIKVFQNFGSTNSTTTSNGLLYNTEDIVEIYNGNPTALQSTLIDSVSWKNNSQKEGFSLQRDKDCVFRWHSSAPYSNIGGYERDADNSLLYMNSPGLQNYNMSISAINSNDTVCFGQDLNFYLPLDTFCGTYLIRWNFGDLNSGNSNIDTTGVNVQHLFSDTGKYIITASVAYGSLVTSVVKTIKVAALPQFDLGNDTSVCMGTSNLILQAYDGISFLWNDQSTASSLKVQSTGKYYVKTSNQYGCIASDTINITYNTSPIVSLGNDTSICQNKNVVLYPGQYASYLWSNNSIASSINVSTSGKYFVEVKDQNGCSASDSIVVAITPSPILSLGNDTSFCSGSNLIINAPIGFSSYEWSTGSSSNTIQITTAGLYSLQVIDSNMCTTSDSILIEEMPSPVVSFVANNVCEGDEVSFKNFSSSGNYSWNMGDGNNLSDLNPVYTYAQAGNYNVVLVVEKNSCIDSVQSILTVYSKPKVSFETNIVSGCMPLDIEFSDTSSMGKKYKWDFGDGKYSIKQMPTHTYKDSGLYSVSLTVISQEGCYTQLKKDNLIEVYPLPKAGFDMDKTELTLTEPEVNFKNNSTGASTFYWYFSDGTVLINNSPFHSFSDTGLFMIKQVVSNQYGCADSIEKSIKVMRDYDFFMPTAFTPNNDGLNDVLKPKGIGLKWYDYSYSIYNRWGEKLFFTNNPKQGWNGTLNDGSTKAEDAAYTWKITVTDPKNNLVKNYSGFCSLVK